MASDLQSTGCVFDFWPIGIWIMRATMHSVTDRRPTDRMMPIADHTM